MDIALIAVMFSEPCSCIARLWQCKATRFVNFLYGPLIGFDLGPIMGRQQGH